MRAVRVFLGLRVLVRLQASTGGMRSQLGVYRDLRDNLSEGLRFYMSVQEAIATLRQQAGDYILTRRLQRCPRFALVWHVTSMQ